ncbi:Ashwin [Oryzias melastigma]|uniref:Ashwin n=1 Tax=Oryzias melastigma TaxID=30732 RepID=A0A834BNL7_ORYME|nr:Ashwin [Oryzias melastigma]
MAAVSGHNGKCDPDADLLLHPELLSRDFLQLLLDERKICTRDCRNRDQLTELYLRNVMPLPQRSLPNNRWGRRMERSRGRRTSAGQKLESSRNDQSRKRPLIVFDGSSSNSGPLKVKKPEGAASSGAADRLKPPPAANLTNPIRKLSSSSMMSSSSSPHRSTVSTNLKQEGNTSEALKSPEVKKKIPRVTWP